MCHNTQQLYQNSILIPGVLLVVHNNKATFIVEEDIGEVIKDMTQEPTMDLCTVIT